ncbi:hypothetical protein M8542_44020 [Amycolatopsis sp. OK19-0408]|uniref:Uncharacterized protein n=1 Tax=Amycolatopsis iheyensis TaxID=2945988 RepID=A0A9X2SP80_9PSEU|nr:hypothetical protein [Amycolatopsis iheyensis]MCR6489802.1 hypothetical protein [Amycolatopsis iheyensis]
MRTALAAAALVPLAAVFTGATVAALPAPDWRTSGAVFVGTNHNNSSALDQPGNQIANYHRGPEGKLTLVGSFATGQGSGTGAAVRW